MKTSSMETFAFLLCTVVPALLKAKYLQLKGNGKLFKLQLRFSVLLQKLPLLFTEYVQGIVLVITTEV